MMRVLFLNPQGNFDRNDSFWTEHPDFGGQLVYVKEIASSMAKQGVQVDIVTRRIEDETFSMFSDSFDTYENIENLRIVRIPCGPKHFLKKEALWEHLGEWVDNIIRFYQQNNETFDFITTHYGDGGLAGAMLSEKTNVKFSFTGHSLGAQKMDKLNVDKDNYKKINETYAFAKRLLAERTAMKGASIVFVSTAQERDEQYKHQAYLGAGDVANPEKFVVAPPGVNTSVFGKDVMNDLEEETYHYLDKVLKRDIKENRLNLPYIVSASRLDPKKNHVGLLKAYAQSQALQSIANIAISLRGVENAYHDFSNLKDAEQAIMKELFNIIHEHDLQGKVTFINILSQKALAASYRYFAKKRSIFTLTALYEPFGLAPIEAMCAGLPVAVTKYGGPSEVLKDDSETYGVLIDVHDIESTYKSLIQAFKHYDYYQKQGLYRVESTYTWDQTAKTYIEHIKKAIQGNHETKLDINPYFKTPQATLDFKSTPIETYYLVKESGDSNGR